MILHQPTSNVVAHGMSSSEEAKYRYDDVDPELLQDPFDVAERARQIREQEARELHGSQLETLGFQVGKLITPSELDG